MNLKYISDKIAYIPNPVNIGIIINNNSVILIDSGIDDDTAKKILKTIEKNGLYPIALINTHSHADHCGGNSYLKNKTGLKIYAPEKESALIENTMFEPYFFSSGARPPKELEIKFLKAKASEVDTVIKEGIKDLSINGKTLEIVSLPGHAINQIGVFVDGICFCADAYIQRKILYRHKIPFNIDIEAQKETLNFLLNTNYEYYLPAHGKLASDAKEDIKVNLERILEIENLILKFTNNDLSSEEIYLKVFDYYQLNINNLQKYYLNKTGIDAFLNYLLNLDKIRYNFKNNKMYWYNNG